MASIQSYRQRAEALRKLAKATKDADEAFAYNLRAVQFDYLADELAGQEQVQQQGTQPPPPPHIENPEAVHQRQQVQPEKDE